MMIHILDGPPDREMAEALEMFEWTFSYPLGIGRKFRISHGEDYPRFFRAISRDASACFVAANELTAPLGAPCERSVACARGEATVLGTLGVALRQLRFPDGECRLSAYLGDLKTAPGPGRGRSLLRLAAEAARWSVARGAVVGYGVVMDGTLKTPVQYTGRSGMHAFREVGKICVLRLPAGDYGETEIGEIEGDARAVGECFSRLSSGKFAPLVSSALREGEGTSNFEVSSPKWHRHPACDEESERQKRSAGVPPAPAEGGQNARPPFAREARPLSGEDRPAGAPSGTRQGRALPGADRSAGAPTGAREAHALPGIWPLARRSAMDPLPLVAVDHSACGILEDTRLAKRLIFEDGQEMLSAHLSSFAYENPRAGVGLIRHALAICARERIAPAMFVGIPQNDLGSFASMLSDIPGMVIAPATVYGTGDDIPVGEWLISTSEI